MILDLTAIRADRDRYYYGVDDMFTRHENILHYMSTNAVSLIPVLLDGLVWHSRITVAGQRRTNFYVKHLIVDSQGRFAKALEWLYALGDPQIVCHGVLVLVSELTWFGAAYNAFLVRKMWLMLQLLVFIISNAILPYVVPESGDDNANRWGIFVGRLLIYIFTMAVNLITHSSRIIKSYRQKETATIMRIAFPKYLAENLQNVISLVLTLVLLVMLNVEPLLYCGAFFEEDDFKIFTHTCADADGLATIYGFLAMVATFLYFSQLSDILVTSMKVSAYYLVCMRMIVETALSLFTLAAVALCISAALSCLEHENTFFNSVPNGFMALIEMVLGMYPFEEYKQVTDDGIIFALVAIFLLCSVVFLINVLIAQFASAYGVIYQDMVGYARLKRIKIIVETMPVVTKEKWGRFIDGLAFDTKLEFNDGDVGLSGGYATTEAANLHPTTEERIERFGGSTETTIPFPDTSDQDEDNDRFGRLEKVVIRTIEKLACSAEKVNGSKGGSVGNSGSHASGNQEETTSQVEEVM